MSITEYLYVDHRRIKTYFEQVSEPRKKEKVANWKAGLAITGPTVEASQTVASREFTIHEMIDVLKGALNPHTTLSQVELLAGSRFAYHREVLAQRVMIPKSASASTAFNGLTLWICKYDTPRPWWKKKAEQWQLFLVEDYHPDDARTEFGTGATSLSILVDELCEQCADTTFIGYPAQLGERFERMIPSENYARIREIVKECGGSFPIEPRTQKRAMQAIVDGFHASGFTSFDVNSLEWGMIGDDGDLGFAFTHGEETYDCTMSPPSEEHEGQCLVEIEFIRDRKDALWKCLTTEPARILKEWGAIVGPMRQIDSLFKIRTTRAENQEFSSRGLKASHDYPLLGYPLFVAEAD